MNNLIKYLNKNLVEFNLYNMHDSDKKMLTIRLDNNNFNSKIKNYIEKRFKWEYRSNYETIAIKNL